MITMTLNCVLLLCFNLSYIFWPLFSVTNVYKNKISSQNLMTFILTLCFVSLKLSICHAILSQTSNLSGIIILKYGHLELKFLSYFLVFSNPELTLFQKEPLLQF